jgi:hypothetical protein
MRLIFTKPPSLTATLKSYRTAMALVPECVKFNQAITLARSKLKIIKLER